ncbi:hypothetical protein IV203_024078 [Nitzschia inconspicua]|uniref:Uncharacterized protein n=1 Tax=Nitzschia inconspicua TaxID=303405 RepID=A0A9K3KBC1_9STRA|nr:hypothetical protein IV203_024078 [Nitzschia inconspicua]
MEYLQRILLRYKTACENRIKDSTQAPDTSTGNGTTTRITIDDRLRLIEAFLSDKAKGKLTSTQQCLTRQELDARNSDLAVEDYFETVSQVFNDESWTPTTESLPDLHPDLADARDLPLKEYRTTRAKVKEKYNEMRHYLHAIVLNWEQSGNGGQQRSDDAEDWGTFDPLLVVDGDDRKNFLPSGEANMYYLLYYWHKLEKEGYLQFTLAKLAEGIRASADEIVLHPINASNAIWETYFGFGTETVGDSSLLLMTRWKLDLKRWTLVDCVNHNPDADVHLFRCDTVDLEYVKRVSAREPA